MSDQSSSTPVPHAGSPTLVTPLDELSALRAEFVAYRHATNERLAELERLPSRVTALEATTFDQHSPTLTVHDRRIGSLENGMAILLRDGADTKAAVMEMRDLLRQFAPAMASVADVVKALDLPAPDPEATPNMRGG